MALQRKGWLFTFMLLIAGLTAFVIWFFILSKSSQEDIFSKNEKITGAKSGVTKTIENGITVIKNNAVTSMRPTSKTGTGHQIIAQNNDNMLLKLPPVAGDCSPEALNVGITHYRYDDAPKDELVTIGNKKIHHAAAFPLKTMRLAAKEDGIILTVGSAYRSIKYQKDIIDEKKELNIEAHDIYTASAPAGYSEHHTGYAVDFTPISTSFGTTATYAWLVDNAILYGWEQSFTPDISRTYGIMVEPWHWRFVGSDAAYQMFNHDRCR